MKTVNYRVTVQTRRSVATTPWLEVTASDDATADDIESSLVGHVLEDARQAGRLWWFGRDEHGIQILINPDVIDHVAIEVEIPETQAPPAEAGGVSEPTVVLSQVAA